MSVILNSFQLEIVRTKQPRLAIGGILGTGKTTALLWHIIAESRRTDPSRILILVRNYTAANNMMALLRENATPDINIHAFNIFTFRSFAQQQVEAHYQILGFEQPPIILDADIDWDVKRRALMVPADPTQWSRYMHYTTEPWFRKELFDRALRISENVLEIDDLLLKEMLLPGNLGWQEVDSFTGDLHDRLRQVRVIAQSDVLHAFHQLLNEQKMIRYWRDSYDLIIIDDAEDNIPLANEWIERLTNGLTEGQVMIAGDPYGSVRQTLGAEPSYFSDLLNRIPTVELKHNYQVGSSIGQAAIAVSTVIIPPQQWDEDRTSSVEVLPTASTYEEMLDQIVDIVEREHSVASPARPFALVTPDLSDAIVVGRLQTLLAQHGIPLSILYGSRRVTDDPYAGAAFTLCQLLWPNQFGAPTLATLLTCLGTLYEPPSALLLHLYAELDDLSPDMESLAASLAPWRAELPWVDGLLAIFSELTQVAESHSLLIQHVNERIVNVALAALSHLTLRDQRVIEDSLKNLYTSAERYIRQVERLEDISKPGRAFAEALGDPGFAPLSQESNDVPSGIFLTTPMKLLELGWPLHGVVLVDFSDDTWIVEQRRFLSDAVLLWRGWDGKDISPPRAHEDTVSQVCTTIRKLLLQSGTVVYLTTSALTRSGEPTRGFRLQTAIKQIS